MSAPNRFLQQTQTIAAFRALHASGCAADAASFAELDSVFTARSKDR